MSPDAPEGQLHTLGLLEQLRAECSGYRENSSALYYKLDRLLMELANWKCLDRPRRFRGGSRQLAARTVYVASGCAPDSGAPERPNQTVDMARRAVAP